MFERKLSDYEITVWSLFVSSLILLFFSFMLKIRSFVDIQNYIFNFDNLLVINILGISFGFIVGFGIRFIFRQRIMSGSPWDNIFDEMVKGAWILIKAKTGDEILGKVFRTSRGSSEREIVLTEPKKVERKKSKGIPDLKEIDGKVLINGKDVNMIIIYNPDN